MFEYEPQNLLVTGGAGFIGANFIRHWLSSSRAAEVPASDSRIINLDLLTYAGSMASLEGLAQPERHMFVRGDICDRSLIEHLLREYTIDTIVHFAAESHVDRSISGPAAFVQTNVVGTTTLLEAARQYWSEQLKLNGGGCRFHHISTDEVYGTLRSSDPAFTEETPFAPNSPYSASKAASDHFVRSYHHTYGMPVTTTNCSNNYGPHQHREKFIPTVIHACLEGRLIPVYGDGSNVRDWLYVEDHCRAIETVIRHGQVGHTYNVGGNNEWSNLDIARLICRLMDERHPRGTPHEQLITFVADRPGHDWRYAVDTSRIRRELGWQPRESFTSGIQKTVDWYLARAQGQTGANGNSIQAQLNAPSKPELLHSDH